MKRVDDMRDDRPIRSGREFCTRYFPKAHAEKRCRCYPPPGVLVIRARPGVNAR